MQLHMGYTGTVRDINIVDLSPYPNSRTSRMPNAIFLSKRSPTVSHFKRYACILAIEYVIFAIGKSVQYRLNLTTDVYINSWSRHETRSFCEGSVMHGPREDVGGGRGNRCTLKITSSIGNKQLSSTPPLENGGSPLELKITFLVRLWNTREACQIWLA